MELTATAVEAAAAMLSRVPWAAFADALLLVDAARYISKERVSTIPTLIIQLPFIARS